MMTIIMTGCGTPSKYEKTGNRKIDAMMVDPNIPDDTKQEILHAYHINKAYGPKRASTSGYRPVVDASICKDCDYETDLAQCQNIASNNTNVTGSAVTNAAIGAGSAALIGAFLDVDPGHMAALGASAGGLQGVGQELGATRGMIARCMAGRGYSVLR